MAILHETVNLGIDIAAETTVLTYTHPTSQKPAAVLPRIDMGVPIDKPVAGGGYYVIRAKMDGHQVTPKSTIVFDSGQTKGILQGRLLSLKPDDTVTLTVQGRPADTDVNVTAALFDATPIQAEDLDGLLDGLIGSGVIEVDHDTGGTDNLQYVTANGIGIDNATIYAFLRADWDAGSHGMDAVRAQSITNVAGRWERPMLLDPGWYVMYYFKQSAWGPDTVAILVE